VGSLTRGEQKSLALHRALAVKVRTNPSLLAVARRRLEWLRGRNPAGAAYSDEWKRLLESPLETLLDVMVSPSVHACALRQENPFVDLVDQKERARIYRTVSDAIDRAHPS
jgi:hypothetical protein